MGGGLCELVEVGRVGRGEEGESSEEYESDPETGGTVGGGREEREGERGSGSAHM